LSYLDSYLIHALLDTHALALKQHLSQFTRDVMTVSLACA